MRLVTYEQVLGHLKLTIPETSPASPAEADLRLKIDQAEALVLDYVNQRRSDGDLWDATVAAWDVTSEDFPPPAQVTAAVLVQLTELYRFRGDDAEGEAPKRTHGAVLHPLAESYVNRFRDPAVA